MRRPLRRRGLTLVEVLVSVGVLSLSTLTAAALFPFSAEMRDTSGSYSRAATIVQRKLEQIRDLPPSSVTASGLRAAGIVDTPDGAASTDTVLSFGSVDSLSTQLPRGDGMITLTNPGTDLVTVSITVGWTNLRNARSTSTAFTYVTSKDAWREP